MPADYKKRIDRLLQIYTLIQGDGGWTAERLAEHFGATPRTIFRDIQVLRQANVPIYHDEVRKCYQIRRDFYMPPLELTFDESLALLSLAHYIPEGDQIPFTKPALKAMSKIRGQLPAPIAQELNAVEEHFKVQLAAAAVQESCQDLYELARKAIASRKALRCKYDSLSGNGTSPEAFLLKPYALFFGQRAWYVVGFHGQRGEVRTLKLNRFVAMAETTQKYEIPTSFSLEKHLGNAWRMIRGKTRHQVELLFDATFAETISDTHWHKSQSFENLDDGSLRFTCTVDGLEEILWWVLSMGSHCRVIAPAELAGRVRAEAEKMVQAYPGEKRTTSAGR